MKKIGSGKAAFILITVAFILEVILSNLSLLPLMGAERIVLGQNGQTDANGFYQTGIIEVLSPVKNISLKLDITDAISADVTVVLTDEGDKYEYALPVKTVYPAVQNTCNFKIYPYGDVKTINVLIQTPAGSSAFIEEVSVNESRGFQFLGLRFLIICVILFFFYSLRKGSPLHSYNCERGNRIQILIIFSLIALLILLGFRLAKINPACVQSIWPHHGQYRELAHALEQGTVRLPVEPDERLINSENPYDTIALMVEQIPYYMDYAYYEGSYYVYFGIIPELLLYLPYYLLTGEDFNNYQAGFVFYALLVIGAFGLCWELAHRYSKKLPFIHYLILSLGICFFSQYVYMIARPDLYNIPILAGNAFTLLGLAGWLRAVNLERGRGVFLALGSFSLALVAGCRPQMLLYCIAAAVLFITPVWKERSLFSKKGIKDTVCLLLPFGIAAIPVGWYNYARFGSIIDFGATYSLTSNDMNHRGFNLERLIHGIYSFLFQPPTTTSDFPYLVQTDLTVGYMGRHIVEFTFGGFFAINFLLLIILFVIATGKRQKFQKEGYLLFWVMVLSSFVITVFDVNSAGILIRYMGDVVPGLLLASSIAWISFLDQRDDNESYGTVSRLLGIAFAGSVLLSFLLIFAEGDSVSLIHHDPQLFYKISSYFQI